MSNQNNIPNDPRALLPHERRLLGFKHVYLIVGEPRTGKTTLGNLATMSRLSTHVDTDGYVADALIDSIALEIDKFLSDDYRNVLVVTFGRHRHAFETSRKNIAVAISAVQNARITICHIERNN